MRGWPLDDKEQQNLKALNTERQVLMLKAAREFSRPKLVHFGKINTHRQASTEQEDFNEEGQSIKLYVVFYSKSCCLSFQFIFFFL